MVAFNDFFVWRLFPDYYFTHIYVEHDSPLGGANVPYSNFPLIQRFYRNIAATNFNVELINQCYIHADIV